MASTKQVPLRMARCVPSGVHSADFSTIPSSCCKIYTYAKDWSMGELLDSHVVGPQVLSYEDKLQLSMLYSQAYRHVPREIFCIRRIITREL